MPQSLTEISALSQGSPSPQHSLWTMGLRSSLSENNLGIAVDTTAAICTNSVKQTSYWAAWGRIQQKDGGKFLFLPLLSTGQAALGLLYPVWVLLVQKRQVKKREETAEGWQFILRKLNTTLQWMKKKYSNAQMHEAHFFKLCKSQQLWGRTSSWWLDEAQRLQPEDERTFVLWYSHKCSAFSVSQCCGETVQFLINSFISTWGKLSLNEGEHGPYSSWLQEPVTFIIQPGSWYKHSFSSNHQHTPLSKRKAPARHMGGRVSLAIVLWPVGCLRETQKDQRKRQMVAGKKPTAQTQQGQECASEKSWEKREKELLCCLMENRLKL